jgi:hypothetical protein
VLGATTMSTPMVFITTLCDWVTSIPTGCYWVLTITTSNTFGEVVLTLVWRCSNMWLPISILCGVECGCVYTFSSLLLIWTNGWVCQLYSPNGLPNSMPLSLFWTTWIFGYVLVIDPLMFLPHSITPHV